MINWVFDDPGKYRTMSLCPQTVIRDDLSIESGRFPTANLFWYWKEADRWANGHNVGFNVYDIYNRPKRYVYNIGTWTDPSVWTGWYGNTLGFCNLFQLVPAAVLEDARQGRALLLIDNLAEGFYTETLYQFWHKSCDAFNLPPASIVYLTSNELDERGYRVWAAANNVTATINVVGFCHFEYQFQKFVKDRVDDGVTVSWEDHWSHKGNNSKSIKTFNCLNRVKRQHREFLFLRLLQEDMLKQGLVSHDTLSYDWSNTGIPADVIERATSLLPVSVDDADFNNNKSMQFNNSIYTKSWISVITETHALEEPHNLFISEKLWKPVHALHPFMVLGHKGTLQRIHEMGYKTFHGLIDESYDQQDFFPRVETIIRNLKLLHLTRDKAGWLDSQRENCLHNRNVFMARDFFNSDAHSHIMSIYDRLGKIV